MAQDMPPPPGSTGSFESWERVIDRATPQDRRPLALTIAGVLLLVAGGFAVLGAGLIFAAGDAASIQGVSGGSSTTPAVLALALAALDVVAGLLVLRRSVTGRVLGMIAAGLGVATGVASIGSPSGLVTIAIFGSILYVLATHGASFRRTSRG